MKHSLSTPIRVDAHFFIKDANDQHLGTVALPEFADVLVRAVNNEQRYREARDQIKAWQASSELEAIGGRRSGNFDSANWHEAQADAYQYCLDLLNAALSEDAS